MGSAYAWLAIKDASADEACEMLGLVRCGGAFDSPETEISGAAMPTGWYLIAVGSVMFDFFMDFSLEELSESHDVMNFDVEEHFMYFKLTYWRGGKNLWNVIHDGGDNVYHLQAEGELPVDFDSLRAEQLKNQNEAGGERAGVDHICEIPLELAHRITGFRYDIRRLDEDAPVFEELDIPDDDDEALE